MVTVWCHGGCARVCVCAPVRAVKLQPERRRALNGTSSSESPTVDGSGVAFKLGPGQGPVVRTYYELRATSRRVLAVLRQVAT
jgi:hypothetical protein